MLIWIILVLILMEIPNRFCRVRMLEPTILPYQLKLSNAKVKRNYLADNNDYYFSIPPKFNNYSFRIEVEDSGNRTEKYEKYVDIALVAKSITPIKRNQIYNITQINSYFDKIDNNALFLKKNYHYIVIKPEDYIINNVFDWYLSVIQVSPIELIDFNYTIRAEFFVSSNPLCPGNCSSRGRCLVEGGTSSCECPDGFLDEDCSQEAIDLKLKTSQTVITSPNQFTYFVVYIKGTTNKFELIAEKNSSKANMEIYLKPNDSSRPILPVKGKSRMEFKVGENEISRKFLLDEKIFESEENYLIALYIAVRIYDEVDVALTLLVTPHIPAITEESFQTVHLVIILVFGLLCILISAILGIKKYYRILLNRGSLGHIKLSLVLVEKYLPLKSFKDVEEFYPDSHEKPSCSVCLVEFIPDDKCRMGICFHIFHSECIDSWLMFHENCPYCRTDMSVAKLEQFTLNCTEEFLEKNKRHYKMRQESLRKANAEGNAFIINAGNAGNHSTRRESRTQHVDEESESFLVRKFNKFSSENSSNEKLLSNKESLKNLNLLEGSFFSKQSPKNLMANAENKNIKISDFHVTPFKLFLGRSNSFSTSVKNSAPILERETFSDIGDYYTQEESLINSENPKRIKSRSKLVSLKAQMMKKSENGENRGQKTTNYLKPKPAMIKTKVKVPEIKQKRDKRETGEDLKKTLDIENNTEKTKMNNSTSFTAIKHISSNHDKEIKKQCLINPLKKTSSLMDSLSYFEIPNTENNEPQGKNTLYQDNDNIPVEINVKRNNLFNVPIEKITGSYNFYESNQNIDTKSIGEEDNKLPKIFKKIEGSSNFENIVWEDPDAKLKSNYFAKNKEKAEEANLTPGFFSINGNRKFDE